MSNSNQHSAQNVGGCACSAALSATAGRQAPAFAQPQTAGCGCNNRSSSVPQAPSSLWATPSLAAGEKEFEKVQNGACYCGWANDYRDCAACRYCRAGPRPAGYPFTPFSMGTTVAAAAIAPPAQAELAYPQSQQLSGAMARADGTVETLQSANTVCEAYGGSCRMGPSDWLAPAGARSVKIAEPDVWAVLPNQIPPAVAINAYHNDMYVADIYNNRKGRLYKGCKPGRAGRCASQ